MRSLIYSPSCLSFAATSMRRNSQRPVSLRGDNFSSKFDSTTIFYDICRVGDVIYLSGPPLYETLKSFNIRWHLGSEDFGWSEVFPALSDVKKCQNSWISAPQSLGENILLSIGDEDLVSNVNNISSSLFSGRRTLVTKSKNNKLEWIRDWVTYHVVNHEIDAVLFYDNNSTDYDAQDVLSAIADAGVDVGVVVRWPYKFGPQGGTRDGVVNAPWDSDFCEYGILEHARCVFLSEADMVINTDIDELVVTPDGRSIKQWLDLNDSGVLYYTGTRIESESHHVDEVPRYYNFLYRDPSSNITHTKWTISPRRAKKAEQWCTHFVKGYENSPLMHDMFRDFRAINNGWKYPKRTERREVIPSHFVVDDIAVNALRKAFTYAYR